MGTLVVRTYPTKLFLKAADHTYVECGTGAKAWSCWGGKSNGAILRGASGSTRRADAIAGKYERAGITCYLINGVCHQAANRILLPAGITVDGARGYSLSVAIFGVYGRPRGLPGGCKAPFDQHPSVSGDLPECTPQADPPPGPLVATDHRPDFSDATYMTRVRRLHEPLAVLAAEPDEEDLLRFSMSQFELLVQHKLGASGAMVGSPAHAALMEIRERFELERMKAEGELAATRDAAAFIRQLDELTLRLQDDVAGVLSPDAYETLFDLRQDERLVLSDPEIVDQNYGSRGGQLEAD